MNRRNFLKFLGAASAGATVAYSFPSIIVPKNIEVIDQINLITKTEIYPKLIEDFWFQESPFMSHMRKQPFMRIIDDTEYGFGYVEQNGVWVHKVIDNSVPEDVVAVVEPSVENLYIINSEHFELIEEKKPTIHRIFGLAN